MITDKDAADAVTRAQWHDQRVREVQAMFAECLRRYKEARDIAKAAGQPHRTDRQIIELSVITLIHNGYTKAEVVDGLAGGKRA